MRAVLRATCLAAMVGTTSLFAAPAGAQSHWGWGWGGSLFYKPPLIDRRQAYPAYFLVPNEVSAMLRDEGYRVLSRPSLQGDVYVVHAEDRGGARLRIVVHAYDGEILQRRVVARTGPDRRTGERPIRRESNQAVLPNDSLPPATPREEQAVAPPIVITPPVAPRQEAVTPPRPVETAPLAPPRDNLAVTPKPAAPPPWQAPAREPQTVAPSPAAPSGKPATNSAQEARSQPRVILPNPNSNQALELEPARPAPPASEAPETTQE